MYKICSKCKIEKLFNEFSKDKNRKDGYHGQCKSCIKEYQQLNRDKISISQKLYCDQNKERLKEVWKNYKEVNEQTLKLKAKLYREANKEKISVYMKEYKKEYRKNNKDKINAKSAERKARKLKARPFWLTKEDLKVIENFYKEAQELTLLTGEQYHVDHIVPLQGENVCGLHVPWNLQVITAKENLSKHNKLIEN